MWTPTRLNNRYEVKRQLGVGGFGETFLAEDTQMPSGRHCVIKQLKPVAENQQVYQLIQERFQREAAILEELGDGSNQIPRLYAYFVENGQFYLVQEYIEGQNLTEKLQQQGLLSESSVKEILTNILPVLDYVHSKRIVHRDIKPENILIRYGDRQPVLIDFGAVKETIRTVVSGNSSQSIVIGTPGFMPSEQTAGRPVFSSDLYSLGLTAIYLLTGLMPQQLETDPATGEIIWRHHALNITPSFAAFLDKAIASHSRDRYSSAREMLQALQTGGNPVVHTAPQSHPTVVSAPPSAPFLQPLTVVSAPPAGVPYQQPIYSPAPIQVNNGMGDWQKAVIMGGVIGAFVVGGLWLTRGQQSTSPEPKSSSTPAEENPAPPPSVSNSVQPQQPINTSPATSRIDTSRPTQILPPTSSITQQDAIDLINQWQEAKKVLFAPPFNRQLGSQLTTGEAYRKNIGANSSLQWLEDNNSYYRYGVQNINSIERFVANGDQATIEIVLTEDRKFYRNGRLILGENTALDTRLVRYSLQMENGQLKISDYNTVRVINSR